MPVRPAPGEDELRERLAARTLELVDIPSESRDEAALAAHVAGVLRDGGAEVEELGDGCVLARPPGMRPPVWLAGHLDTVPAQGNIPGSRDGERVHGLGASDMKGALAVMIELVLGRVPYAALFFPREELPATESALTPLLARAPVAAEFVVVMEPTGGELHAGCLGNVAATWTFRGRSGHSARPWDADNAIHRAAIGVAQLASAPSLPVESGGLIFQEVASVTQISGGIAANVIPDECVCGVNFRYAPGRTPAEAEARLRALCRRAGRPGRRRQLRRRPGRRRAPAGPQADRRRRPAGRAQAGVDAGGRVRRRRLRRGQLRPGRARPGAPARRVRRSPTRSCTPTACWRPRRRDPPPLPGVGAAWPRTRSCAWPRRRRGWRRGGSSCSTSAMGEPREETPAFIREALVGALEPMSTYPTADGLPELRAAIAGWVRRRFGAALDPDAQVLPTLGSKEAIFSLAQVFDGDTVVVPTPSYPVYERGAQFAGKRVVALPLRERDGWLPDLYGVDWDRVAVLWLNYPNNPTAATASLEFYERAAALARRHGFVLASDEAYSELYFGDAAPVSALQVSDLGHVAVFNTLSKRSSMPGYRTGFVAGDPAIVAALKRYRPNVGVAPQEFIQRAAACRLERRGARGGGARPLPGQARRPARGARGGGPAQRGRRRHLLPLAARRRGGGAAGRRAARRRASC